MTTFTFSVNFANETKILAGEVKWIECALKMVVDNGVLSFKLPDFSTYTEA
jgi:hypothetical protein